MRLMLVAAAAAMLVGCATAPQEDPGAAFVAARAAAMRSCGADTPASARALLAAKLANVTGGRATLEQLGDTTVPSAPEKAAIKELAEQRDACRMNLAEVHDQYGYGGAGSILRASFPAVRGTYAELYAGTISYGEANRRFDEIQARTVEAVNEYGRAMDAQQAQVAEARRLAALQMFQQWSINNRPIQTNCTRIGTQAQCISR
jgi:hypothetical protein